MKKIVLLIVLQFSVFNLVYGQNVSIEIVKEKYELHEKFSVIYRTNFEEDSIQLPKFTDVKVVSEPSKMSSTSFINGKRSQEKSWTYILRANKKGKLYIESPVFFIGGKEIKAKRKKIRISKSKLSKQQEQDVKFNAFIVDEYKPDGSYRYTLDEEFGYIEVFTNLKWVFLRKLTKEECELIRSIK